MSTRRRQQIADGAFTHYDTDLSDLPSTPEGREDAIRRAEQTLEYFLNAEQLLEWQETRLKPHRSFTVTGCDTGKRYRLINDRSSNIRELDKHGEPYWIWCLISTKPGLPVADLMLTQKLALETNEREIMREAVSQGSDHPQVPVHVYEREGIWIDEEAAFDIGFIDPALERTWNMEAERRRQRSCYEEMLFGHRERSWWYE